MSKVAIVTDSTAYIPNEITKGYPIFSCPLFVLWEHETLKDGIDITPRQFYERLQNSKTIPTTSQVTPEQFKITYQDLISQGYEILSIHISEKLSGTLDSARQAKKEFPDTAIEIMNSESTSMGLGFQVLRAARAAATGASLEECRVLAEKVKENYGIYFIVDTLEYLHRGGRIGGAAAFIGTALNLKPLLTLIDGKVESYDKVRTKTKAIDRIIDATLMRMKTPPFQLSCLHANAPDEAAEMLDRIRSRLDQKDITEMILTEISPVIGVHTGPGTLGIVFTQGI